MTFTDIMLAHHKAEIYVKILDHNGEKNILLKFETDHGLASVFLSENQVKELFEKVENALNQSKFKVVMEHKRVSK